MKTFTEIEQIFIGSFKVINGLPQQISLHQLKDRMDDHLRWDEEIKELSMWGLDNKLDQMSFVLNKNASTYKELCETLIKNGFSHYASRIEVTKDLNQLEVCPNSFEYRNLEDPRLSTPEFKNLWEQCMLHSDNAASTMTMDQHLSSVQNELGEKWKHSCGVFYTQGSPIGVSMPHIEPGTVDEGRLFYFGLLPEERGKGLGTILHHQSLILLKNMGARYYVDGTHLGNRKMQSVFEKNGCTMKSQTESFYKYYL